MSAAVAACVAFGGSQGFAASPGAGSPGLGATSTIVGACGARLTFGYGTAFDPRIGGYAIDRIELSNIPSGCLGKSLSATFFGSGNAPVGSPINVPLPASGTAESIGLDPNSNMIAAVDVSGVSVVVS